MIVALTTSACGGGGEASTAPGPGPTPTNVDGSTTTAGVSPIDASTPPPALTIGAPVEAAAPVAPPENSPVHRIRRDCPLTERMDDGRILWMFCDSSMHDLKTGDLTVFQNTTAGWAQSDDPLTVNQVVDRTNNPYRFLKPTAAYNPCGTDPAWKRFLWLDSSIKLTEPDGTNRVLIYYQSMCAKSGLGISEELFHDVGLAMYVYDPANPPDINAPIEGEVLEENLFTRPGGVDAPFGVGAVLRDNIIYVYRCTQSGDCFVGRVVAQDAASKDKYEFWNGSTWVPGEANAVKMDMPGHTTSFKPSIDYVAASNLYVMLDSADIGKGDAQLLVSRTPYGPWSPPQRFVLPACVFAYPQMCFGLELHPELSNKNGLFITWLDPNIPNDLPPVQSVHVPVTLTPPKDKNGQPVADQPTLTG